MKNIRFYLCFLIEQCYIFGFVSTCLKINVYINNLLYLKSNYINNKHKSNSFSAYSVNTIPYLHLAHWRLVLFWKRCHETVTVYSDCVSWHCLFPGGYSDDHCIWRKMCHIWRFRNQSIEGKWLRVIIAPDNMWICNIREIRF
jgi:hypothetical protein